MQAKLVRVVSGLSLLLILILAATASAVQYKVTLKDGSTRLGELVSEDETTITLRINGVATTFNRDSLQAPPEPQLPIKDQFIRRRGALDDSDIKGRTELVKWLIDKNALDIAKSELADLRKRAPDDENIGLLTRVVDDRIADARRVNNNGGSTTKPSTNGSKPPKNPSGLLTPEQINIIRVYETNLETNPKPRMTIPQETVDALITQYSTSEKIPKNKAEQDNLRFAARTEAWKILRLIFDLGAKQFYSSVKISEDPPSMKYFRTQIYPYVMNYCATATCHGGPNAGNFYLIHDDWTSDAAAYTNFFIMHEYKNQDGNMIDRKGTKPEESLLIQYSLVVEKAVHPHPDVKDWRPKISDPLTDANYIKFLTWIRGVAKNTNGENAGLRPETSTYNISGFTPPTPPPPKKP